MKKQYKLSDSMKRLLYLQGLYDPPKNYKRKKPSKNNITNLKKNL
jgi:hypothetical protein